MEIYGKICVRFDFIMVQVPANVYHLLTVYVFNECETCSACMFFCFTNTPTIVAVHESQIIRVNAVSAQ
jgi:hypothetical protein